MTELCHTRCWWDGQKFAWALWRNACASSGQLHAVETRKSMDSIRSASTQVAAAVTAHMVNHTKCGVHTSAGSDAARLRPSHANASSPASLPAIPQTAALITAMSNSFEENCRTQRLCMVTPLHCPAFVLLTSQSHAILQFSTAVS